ncbi:MAG TPA: CapA family protein [Thioalkalivibrio sp.]|nr:CapA family protein [Thioalkalivibrio sp.]
MQGTADPARPITLFLCGDVMTGRGIDQVLPHSNDPVLFEPYARSARDYVTLAEKANGPIPAPVDFEYIWGDALAELARVRPDLRIVNLETAVTTSDDRAHKGIHYRMHPANVPVLTTAGIDCAVLANNHVLDWGRAGLAETLATLADVDLATAGAGPDLAAATAPAVLPLGRNRRVLVHALGHESSGIPRGWAATPERSGVALLDDLSPAAALEVAAHLREVRRPGDIVVASLHWGGNWGHHIPAEQRACARALIDAAGVDIVHGHSSHHVKGIEVYRDRLILYGCGDFISDYEGISGYETFRDDLGLMYFVTVDPASGALCQLEMTPTRVKRFRLRRATPAESRWLEAVLNREGEALGTRVTHDDDGRLTLHWD